MQQQPVTHRVNGGHALDGTSVTFNKPLPVDEGTMRYTGLINLNIEEDDTLVPNIALTKSGALNASSKKRLAESGLTHHARGETW